MKKPDRERYSLLLLLSLMLFIVLSPFLEAYRGGELILLILIYITVVTATLELSERRSLQLPASLLAGSSMLALLGGHFRPVPWLVITSWALLMIFFGLASVGLFRYLGMPGSVTNGRIYGSVSLYFILAIFWFAIYHLVEAVYPGSFSWSSPQDSAQTLHGTLLYFSLVTLTTLGYGDVIPVSPVARMFAALEAATGILYIAITVARLVSAYQRSGQEKS
jgi:voltage-gated potassium channel Kch